MKSLFKVLSLSFLAAFIALGCSNTSNDAFSNALPANGGKAASKTINLVATGDAEAIRFPTVPNGISATIVADTIGADTLKYYLYYTNKVTGTTKNPDGPLNFTAADPDTPNIGTVPLNIEDGYYLFKLYASTADIAGPNIPEGTVSSGALFLGQTEADLRTSTDTVSFYLTSDTLTGSAAVALKLMTTGWAVPAGFDISAGITKKTDGSYVPGPGADTISSIDATEPATPQFSKTGVTAGTYNFDVIFANATTGKTYVWSDTIIIAPNHNIEKTIKIPPVIDLPPAAPTAFNATFKDPDSISKDKYYVEFDWAADTTVNELYFQIELLEIPAATAWGDINADTSTEWTDAYRTTLGNTADSYMTILDKDFYGNEAQGWVSGSLRKNNTTAVAELPLGKRYLARIAAVNDAGPSAYCYVDFDDSVPAAVTTGYSKFAPASKVINRYRLTYNLLGGTIDIDGAGATSTKDIVEYRTQNTVANSTANTYKGATTTTSVDDPTADIWNPSTDVDTYKSLKKGSKNWTQWRTGSSSSASVYPSTAVSPYNPEDYVGCENLVLYASYSPTTAGVTILDDNDWSVKLDNFTATAPAGLGVDTSDLATKSTIALDLATAGAGSILWTGAYTTEQKNRGVKWTNVTYTIKKSGETYNRAGPSPVDTLTDADGFTVTTNLKPYLEGTYLVTFNAYAAHKAEPYTYTIVVVISSN
ncbi:MAG: hypothetical protein II814_04290 [Treponema sp.]|nr:hypothetical protein [Treponema sp.]